MASAGRASASGSQRGEAAEDSSEKQRQISPQSGQGIEINSSKSATTHCEPDNREAVAGIQDVSSFALRGAAVLSSRRLLPAEASERFFELCLRILRALRMISFA
jgi:hypothetical protein